MTVKILCTLFFFSPLAVTALEVCDSLWLYDHPNSNHCKDDWKEKLTTEQILPTMGYMSVSTRAVTEDGYVLKLIMAWDHYKNKKEMKPNPIVIGHGNMMNSNSFLLLRESSIANRLIEQGYYVYFVNFRGNYYSNSHRTIRDREKYWNFSFDEMGKYDMPAIMKEVQRLSKGAKAVFLGYGMANTAAFVYASTKPQEAEKYLKGIVAWAPLVYLSHMKSPFWYAAQVIPLLEPIVKEEWQGKIPRSYDMVKKYCTKYTFQLFICNLLRIPNFGDNLGQINPEALPLGLLSRTDQSSYTMLVHYSQMIQSGKFAARDLGKKANLLNYKQEAPVLYNISAVPVPVALYYGPNDWLTDEVDVEQLYCELNPKTRCGMNRINYHKFSHTDFIEGKNADTLLYKPTLETIAQMCTDKCKP